MNLCDEHVVCFFLHVWTRWFCHFLERLMFNSNVECHKKDRLYRLFSDYTLGQASKTFSRGTVTTDPWSLLGSLNRMTVTDAGEMMPDVE